MKDRKAKHTGSVIADVSTWTGLPPVHACAGVCCWEWAVDVHQAAECLQHKVCSPCPFVYKGLICIKRNTAFESSFSKMPRLDSCNVQSVKRHLYWSLWRRTQIQVIVAQPVSPSHEMYSYFDNSRGKQFLFKGRKCYGNKFGDVCREKILAKRKAVSFLKERFETAQHAFEAQSRYKAPWLWEMHSSPSCTDETLGLISEWLVSQQLFGYWSKVVLVWRNKKGCMLWGSRRVIKEDGST